jgi:hypothetical protein
VSGAVPGANSEPPGRPLGGAREQPPCKGRWRYPGRWRWRGVSGGRAGRPERGSRTARAAVICSAAGRHSERYLFPRGPTPLPRPRQARPISIASLSPPNASSGRARAGPGGRSRLCRVQHGTPSTPSLARHSEYSKSGTAIRVWRGTPTVTAQQSGLSGEAGAEALAVPRAGGACASAQAGVRQSPGCDGTPTACQCCWGQCTGSAVRSASDWHAQSRR